MHSNTDVKEKEYLIKDEIEKQILSNEQEDVSWKKIVSDSNPANVHKTYESTW